MRVQIGEVEAKHLAEESPNKIHFFFFLSISKRIVLQRGAKIATHRITV